ncbi:PEGA domain-containing protein [bacterium]|nr:PEGA domain-containing protein [bacterium]
MDKRIRDTIFYVFVILFVFLTISISLYAAGYKLNLSWPIEIDSLLQKTGTLEISTSPRGANIYLEKQQKIFLSNLDKKQEKLKTPNKISRLTPGKYNLKLELEGYWTWEDEIEIEENKALYIEDINLFKKNLPLLIYSTLPQKMYLSDNYTYSLMPFEKQIINLKNNNTINLPEVKINDWKFSNDQKNIITDQYIFNIETKKVTIIENKDFELKNLKCNDDKKYFFYQKDNSIFKYNIEKSEIENIFNTYNCQDYLMQNNRLYTIENNTKESLLKEYNLSGELLNQLSLPFSFEYRFTEINNNYINIFQKKYSTLYIIDLDDKYKPIKSKIDNYKQGVWDNNNLIFSNNFEIYGYNIKNDEKYLITRTSEKIENIMPNTEKNYIIYSTKNSLYMIDWQNRDYNTNKLISLEEIYTPALDKKNNQIYFNGKIGQQSGIYKLLVQ